MALSEAEQRQFEREMGAFLERRRPPAHVRSKVDVWFRIQQQSVEIFEIRPRWDRPGETVEHPLAKATYVRSQGVWKVYWMRHDFKWHGYEPQPVVQSLRAFAKFVDEDKHACFFG